ncbi:MAG: chemotaxis protein CheW [Pseudomonadota bacterium]
MTYGSTAEPQDIIQLATFLVGGEEYALDIMRIKEIINPLRITPVPKAPSFIEGMVGLRGVILPIVDLRKRFDLPAPPPSRATKYVIIGIEGRIVGLVVDAVKEVLRVPRIDVRPAPELVEGDASHYFSGVCHHRGRIFMVLDIDRILSTKEKISLARLDSTQLHSPGG